ncbi:uncharacterized protein MONBRDRAFT_29170 [Monosiga brevicollis MX1]|uniref:Calnexin n=1 Tax=Monosiga brevicollis TaxID=81824 RepID=A9VAB4_MONBE|nr:uncharacterized protein MONBRDRAFT_29170 [Monosiga brevicollis MX1]EDQ85457.1 predicted protein [Monosiga brevicollis MX1]|eukprot:XP_001749648.1 hypothetical protein [Monosiga brevicollis MX1]
MAVAGPRGWIWGVLCLVMAGVWAKETVLLRETFEDYSLNQWTRSGATKPGASADIAQYAGRWALSNGSLVMKGANQHYGLAKALDSPFSFKNGLPLVVQYEVRFRQVMVCGGAYIKLLESTADLTQLNDKAPFTIMFGPDKCGDDAKLHFIFRYPHPRTGVMREVHARRIENVEKLIYTDKKTHLVTLVLKPSGEFALRIDRKQVLQGDMASSEDCDPPLLPPAEIPDPSDQKPADWVDEEFIDDPTDQKPADWDEEAPQYIPDPTAQKPELWDENEPSMIPDPASERPMDWDDEEDGVWESPRIPNPKCEMHGCGPWTAPSVANPQFRGVWQPRRLPNPDYFEDAAPFDKLRDIGAVAFELWTITPDVHFDNLIVTTDEAEADQMARELWLPKHTNESSGEWHFGPFEPIVELLLEWIDEANANPLLYILYTAGLSLVAALLILVCSPSNDATPSSATGQKQENNARAHARDEQDDGPTSPASEPTANVRRRHTRASAE